MQTLEYRCPGEAHPIPRAVHLARLSGFYHACRQCPHRDDHGTMSTRRAGRLADTLERGAASTIFDAEGIAADYLNQFTPLHARWLGRAVGQVWQQAAPETAQLALIGSDGGHLTPELVAALSEGLRWSGTVAVESGATSPAALVMQQQARRVAGAIYVAQSLTPRHRVVIRMWGRDGRPLSQPGGLDPVGAAFNAVQRPVRRFAGRQRWPEQSEYLESLRSHFHALRPLRFVMSCDCPPVLHQLEELLSRVGCTMLASRGAAQLVNEVRANQAHFAVALSEQGEALRVWDERGQPVEPVALTGLLAKGIGTPLPCEPTAAGARLSGDRNTSREVAFGQMLKSGQLVRVFRDQRCWWNIEGRPVADALRGLAVLLVALSQNDRPLSQVVADLA